ncbi:Flagellar M-ring protein fliF [Aequoribacter fuscus]|uniref:Flagellar M-ring protein n=1 Tax=Aequoribacter fuscus TaxID=2518989 RepID=F3L307_9GAMM|nr:flagellar basal-body MS-ring/collar protein FliF [Aequoribacter fuscus]EGG29302.1 Flagellar M-ring protein fliF [Aequoribacter fuscus]QHJ89115.1 flagellar M-ring protein FliF [Aequoribacter fuscus]
METVMIDNASNRGGAGVPSLSGQDDAGGAGSSKTASEPNQNTALSTTATGLAPTVRRVLQQPAVKRSMPAISVLLAVLLFVIFGSMLNSTGYRSISNGMSEPDRQASYDALLASQYKVRINPASGMIEVPDGSYQQAKLFLASQGLPRSAIAGGYSALNENASMTQSQFMEQVQYNNAMELELAKTISQIDSIESARVHIAVNKQSVFVRERMPSKASVVVKPYFGRVVTQPQVQSIIHLVSSSVPYMSTTDVTVVDNYGILLSSDSSDDSLGTQKNIDFERRMEAELSGRIVDLIMPVLGEGNVKSIVNVDVDFTETESTFEEFDRSGTGPKTRSEVLSNDEVIGQAAAGIPGGVSNIAPDAPELEATGAAAGAGAGLETTQRTQTTRNYELDKAVRYVKEQPGRVLGLTAAIMLNESALRDLVLIKLRQAAGTTSNSTPLEGRLAPDSAGDVNATSVGLEEFSEQQINEQMDIEIERFRGLVIRALPFDDVRGDSINIAAAPFYIDAPIEIITPWWEQEGIVEWGKHGFTVIAFLFLLLLVVRPIMAFYMPKPSVDDLAVLAEKMKDGELTPAELEALEKGETLEEIKAKLKPKKSSISADMLDTANTYDDKVALIRLLVAEDSGRVANVLKKMIKPA